MSPIRVSRVTSRCPSRKLAESSGHPDRLEADAQSVSFTHPLRRDVTLSVMGPLTRRTRRRRFLLLSGSTPPSIRPLPAAVPRRLVPSASASRATRQLANSRSTQPTVRGKKKPAILNLAVMAVVVPGLFCTVALPAYAFQDQQDAGSAAAELQALKESGAQTVDGRRRRRRRRRRARRLQASPRPPRCAASRMVTTYRAWTRPVGRRPAREPAVPELRPRPGRRGRQAVPGRAVPLRRRQPVGLRLLGLHPVRLRAVRRRAAALVVRVRVPAERAITPPSRALPGDLVVMDGGGHVGIYLGGNMMIDAPRAGTVVAGAPDLQPDALVRPLRHLSRRTALTCRCTAVTRIPG